MLKKFCCFALSIMLMVLSFPISNIEVNASERSEPKYTQLIDGIEYSSYGDKSNVNVRYIDRNDNEVLFFSKEDGNIYMKINDEKEILAVTIEPLISHQQLDGYTNRAGSEWLLQSSGNMRKITVSANIVDMGKGAIVGALIGAVKGAAGGVISSLTGAGLGALESLAAYIAANLTSYTSTVIYKKYVYNGCSLLLGGEVAFPSGHTTFGYSWLENPVLGVVPYVCKYAAQTYRY